MGAVNRQNQGRAGQGSKSVREFLQSLDTLVRARYPLIHLASWEEQRVELLLGQLARQHGKQLLSWSCTQGLRRLGGARQVAIEGSEDPQKVLEVVAKLSEPSIVVLCDFHPYLESPRVVRRLRELAHQLKSTWTTVILLSPSLNIPVELEKELSVMDVPLPDFDDLAQLLREIVGVVRRNNRATVELNPKEAGQMVKAAMGLTLSEAENAFARAIAHNDRLDAADISRVLEEKKQVIRKSGLLEYFAADENLQAVGGLENLKLWLRRRGAAFDAAARKFGLPEPKGLLLLGVQGCGKSLTAKAVASQWNLPLLRLDIGRIFSGLVGSSEENLRRAIRAAEGVAPAVLWIDEIEKGLAGSTGSGDTGVSARVFGALLTWLQEKTAPVFVVATANRIESLPPELLRKGRFDEIFFIDLPSPAERKEILSIHLARRNRTPESFDLKHLAALSENFSGSELEQAVVSGLYHAFDDRTELTQQLLEQAFAETYPLATTMEEEISALRHWAKHRTRPASKLPSTKRAPTFHATLPPDSSALPELKDSAKESAKDSDPAQSPSQVAAKPPAKGAAR